MKKHLLSVAIVTYALVVTVMLCLLGIIGRICAIFLYPKMMTHELATLELIPGLPVAPMGFYQKRMAMAFVLLFLIRWWLCWKKETRWWRCMEKDVMPNSKWSHFRHWLLELVVSAFLIFIVMSIPL